LLAYGQHYCPNQTSIIRNTVNAQRHRAEYDRLVALRTKTGLSKSPAWLCVHDVCHNSMTRKKFHGDHRSSGRNLRRWNALI